MTGRAPRGARASATPSERLRRLLRADMRNIARDPLLAFAALMSALPALLLRFGADALDQTGRDWFGIADLSGLLAPSFAAIPAFFIGWMVGFLILEERDEGVSTAIATTPVGKDGFLAYRLALSVAACFVLTPLNLAVANIEAFSLAAGLALAVFGAMEAAIVALILAAVAANKVEGLAVTKLINIALVAPAIAGLDGAWRWIAAVAPPFWIGAVAHADGAGVIWTAAAGLAAHAAALWLALAAYRRRVG